MRTTIQIDDSLAEDVFRFSQAPNRAKALSLALEDWVYRKKMDELISLRGQFTWEGNLENLRALEVAEPREHYGRRSR
jgi:Arc/MetJ family transcription regulator